MGVKSFLPFSASCWTLGGGFYSRIEPDFHLLAQLMRLPIRLSVCLLPVSKLTNGGIESFLLVPSRFNGLQALHATLPRHRRGFLSLPHRTALVTCCGRICIYKKKINLSTSLAGQAVGIKEVDDGIWLVSFMDYDLGYIDLEEKTLQPLNNPFGPKV